MTSLAKTVALVVALIAAAYGAREVKEVEVEDYAFTPSDFAGLQDEIDELIGLEEVDMDLLDTMENYKNDELHTYGRFLNVDDDNVKLPKCRSDEECNQYAPNMSCMRLAAGREKNCVPMECFREVADDFKRTVLTQEFMQGLFTQAGVSRREIVQTFMKKREYRQDPHLLLAFDNPFSRFMDVFNANAPDMREAMQRTQDCIPSQTVQGITFLAGISYGGGAGVRLDFENTWGTGSGDIGGSVNGTVTQFVPSSFFAIAVSCFLGANVDLVGTFSWIFTGTKEDIPFDYLIWGGRLGVVFPHGAVEGLLLFRPGFGQLYGVQVEGGAGLGGGINVGYKKAFMVFNGTQIVPADPSASLAPSQTP